MYKLVDVIASKMYTYDVTVWEYDVILDDDVIVIINSLFDKLVDVIVCMMMQLYVELISCVI